MPFVERDGLHYFQFESFNRHGLVHGGFTRHGGVSPAPWASLNQGGTVGDERANVVENRRRIFTALGRPVESVFDVWQVHSKDVICSEVPRPLSDSHRKADAIATQNPAITLFMRFADCVPVLFYDPVQRVVAMAHAGWQGTVQKVAAATVEALVERYGSRPADLIAGIGPSIGPDHYVIGEDVINATRDAFGPQADELFVPHAGRVALDLWKANQLTLQAAGVEQIETAGTCTACHTEDWYSHRGEHGKTGRYGFLLALPPD
jgi:YfiH family protein